MPFRFNAKRAFLTYPQCGDLTKERLLEFLRDERGALWYCVGLEQHEDGGNHLHAYAEWADRLDVRDERHFDVAGQHPNVQSMAVGWVPYGNTTTDILAPVQVPPFFNPRFFETTGNQAFTGDGYIIPFDKTKWKDIKSYTIAVNPAGDVEGTQFSMPTPFNLWFPVNRKMQFIDPIEGGITQDTLGFKHGSYYLVMQVIASAAGTQSDNVAVMAHRVSTYFRDI